MPPRWCALRFIALLLLGSCPHLRAEAGDGAGEVQACGSDVGGDPALMLLQLNERAAARELAVWPGLNDIAGQVRNLTGEISGSASDMVDSVHGQVSSSIARAATKLGLQIESSLGVVGNLIDDLALFTESAVGNFTSGMSASPGDTIVKAAQDRMLLFEMLTGEALSGLLQKWTDFKAVVQSLDRGFIEAFDVVPGLKGLHQQASESFGKCLMYGDAFASSLLKAVDATVGISRSAREDAEIRLARFREVLQEGVAKMKLFTGTFSGGVRQAVHGVEVFASTALEPEDADTVDSTFDRVRTSSRVIMDKLEQLTEDFVDGLTADVGLLELDPVLRSAAGPPLGAMLALLLAGAALL